MTAIELGFKDEEEMQLYKDVCCTNGAVTSPKTLEELLENLKSNVEHEDNKKAYEDYIKAKGLFELFSKVKDMSVLDRLIEVFLYYSNIRILNNECQNTLFKESDTGYIDLSFHEIIYYIYKRVETMPKHFRKEFYEAAKGNFDQLANCKK